ncbi:unnamed protein product [Calypogeia fissa]
MVNTGMRASCGKEGEPGRCKQAESCRKAQQRYDKGRVKQAVQQRYEAAACMSGMSKQQAGASMVRRAGRSIHALMSRLQHPQIDVRQKNEQQMMWGWDCCGGRCFVCEG